ncbi:putative fluoride ion transporter CrcB [Methylopila jiangsuensis]|uniref:Fluoride-specific ion channel FluC n=1 Tax=Methylopila jiangsuensis TaxID=586230 RepID=A0A9W6N3P1_9HYPH|nr:fluoride efflux transporter CrcB [Methylopila jiangsuensis]MDR6287012.1 CrcB protein [Methylopila jiangsuensis]GLK76498.1 putative fluoride ion transporter CrcB [Methylopila jiangsuensis]
MGFIIVFLGAGLGGALRHAVNLAALRWLGSGFPVGTMAINIAGSFAMGLIAALFVIKGELPQEWRLFLTTGVLGGFTTFSAFSLETALLYERGETLGAAAYVAASIILSIAAVFAGLQVMRLSGA